MLEVWKIKKNLFYLTYHKFLRIKMTSNGKLKAIVVVLKCIYRLKPIIVQFKELLK